MFLSDNTVGAAPEVVDALTASAKLSHRPYSDDNLTVQLTQKLADIFETKLEVFLVPTGTSANALALSCMTPSYGSVICTADAHVVTDECGAIENATAGARLEFPSDDPKLEATLLDGLLSQPRDVHSVKPSAVAITQATERGLVYSTEEIHALGRVSQDRNLNFHMDGARFSNAVAALGESPSDLTWRAGVKTLAFGGTKNGCFAAEAVLLFDPNLSQEMHYRRKQRGYLLSKSWFMAAQFLAMVDDNRWLTWANNANTMAKHLSEKLEGTGAGKLAWPVEANEVFIRLSSDALNRLHKNGIPVGTWPDPSPTPEIGTLVRLVTSYATNQADIDTFVRSAVQSD